MSKNILDYMSEEDYARYNELIAKANEAKAIAKANKPKAERKPMTNEQKVKAAENRLAKARAALEALLGKADAVLSEGNSDEQ